MFKNRRPRRKMKVLASGRQGQSIFDEMVAEFGSPAIFSDHQFVWPADEAEREPQKLGETAEYTDWIAKIQKRMRSDHD